MPTRAHGLGGHVIADGGCTCPGDVSKAFAAGADFCDAGRNACRTRRRRQYIISKYFMREYESVDGEMELQSKRKNSFNFTE